MNTTPLPITDIPADLRKTIYPPPYATQVQGRSRRRVGDYFGLANFGINMTEIAPGSVSALLHKHAKQDEFIYIIAGTPTLMLDDKEYLLQPGDCCGFKAGSTIAHQLVNKSQTTVVYLEVGDRSLGDVVEYPNDDLSLTQDAAGAWLIAHKDGSPY
jgi:uncharacterized cupin superfamily protein